MVKSAKTVERGKSVPAEENMEVIEVMAQGITARISND